VRPYARSAAPRATKPIGFQRIGVWNEETTAQKIEHFGLMFGALAASPRGAVQGHKLVQFRNKMGRRIHHPNMIDLIVDIGQIFTLRRRPDLPVRKRRKADGIAQPHRLRLEAAIFSGAGNHDILNPVKDL